MDPELRRVSTFQNKKSSYSHDNDKNEKKQRRRRRRRGKKEEKWRWIKENKIKEAKYDQIATNLSTKEWQLLMKNTTPHWRFHGHHQVDIILPITILAGIYNNRGIKKGAVTASITSRQVDGNIIDAGRCGIGSSLANKGGCGGKGEGLLTTNKKLPIYRTVIS